jgi:PilZ domain
MENDVERRAARRFSMNLPVKVRFSAGDGVTERQGETRDVSFRGLYFMIEASLETGSSIEFVLTLPQQITLAGDVNIRCYAHVLRVEPRNGRRGVAARIERYEFLPASA